MEKKISAEETAQHAQKLVTALAELHSYLLSIVIDLRDMQSSEYGFQDDNIQRDYASLMERLSAKSTDSQAK